MKTKSNFGSRFDTILALLTREQDMALATEYHELRMDGAMEHEAIASVLQRPVQCAPDPETGCPYDYIPVEMPGIAADLRDDLLADIEAWSTLTYREARFELAAA